MIQTVMLPLTKVVENRGQIPGVPGNPRKINPGKMQKLMQSIRDYPGMIELRELLVYPYGGKYVLIAGNMRRRALKMLNYAEVPCKVLPSDTSPELLNAYILRDNSHYGEWDFDFLKSDFSFGDIELANIQVPKFDFKTEEYNERPLLVDRHDDSKHTETEEAKPGLSPYKNKGDESRCDLAVRPAIHFYGEFALLSSFTRTESGYPLSELKTDGHVEVFAQAAFDLCKGVMKFRSIGGWSIITPPFRRHKENNFADKVCTRLSALLGVEYVRQFAQTKNKDRINPVFAAARECANNVILYDDITTTRSTLQAMHNLLPDKNVLSIVGIYNH